jgi:hypothetical protein
LASGLLRSLVLGLCAVTAASHADYMDHFVVRDDVGLRKSPSLGPAKLLLLPVEVAGFPVFDRAELERFYGPASGGFVDYYVTASLGRFQHREERYELAGGAFVEREALRAGETARIVARPDSSYWETLVDKMRWAEPPNYRTSGS